MDATQQRVSGEVGGKFFWADQTKDMTFTTAKTKTAQNTFGTMSAVRSYNTVNDPYSKTQRDTSRYKGRQFQTIPGRKQFQHGYMPLYNVSVMLLY